MEPCVACGGWDTNHRLGCPTEVRYIEQSFTDAIELDPVVFAGCVQWVDNRPEGASLVLIKTTDPISVKDVNKLAAVSHVREFTSRRAVMAPCEETYFDIDNDNE